MFRAERNHGFTVTVNTLHYAKTNHGIVVILCYGCDYWQFMLNFSI